MPKELEEQLDKSTTEGSSTEGGEENQPQDANAEGADQGAESSTAEGSKDAKEEDKVTLLSVVQDVVKKDSKSEDSSTSDGGKKAGETEAEGKKEGEKPDAKADDDSKLPFHNHPRWQQMVAENRELKADATIGISVREYQRSTGVNDDELKELLTAGALGKTDPEKAIPVVEAYLEKLKAATGDKLPDDLAQKVKDGYMDEETARSLSKERAKRVSAEARASAAEQETENENARAANVEVVGAVDVWEQQQKAKDPDYAKKQALVHAFVREDFVLNGRPKSKDDAIKVAEKALKRANETLGAVASKPTPTPKTPTSKTGKSGVVAQPKTLLDAVKMAADGK